MMESKTLIMCYLDGHWLPFRDMSTCKAYLVRLNEEFNINLDKVRLFNAVFTEIELPIKNLKIVENE